MKTLKFAEHLVPLVLSGEKTSTWRLFDDKDLAVGDELMLIDRGTGEPFGTATITRVTVRTLGTLTDADWEGHERFPSEDAMYEAYRGYYGESAGPESEVKIISFAFKSLAAQ